MVRRDLRRVLGIPPPAESLAKRKQNFLAECREKQREYFWSKRDPTHVPSSEVSIPIKKKENPRIEMLRKWKEEKMRKIEEEKKKKKPIFKVGVIHRKATGSPLLTTDTRNYGKKNPVPLKGSQVKVETQREGVTTRLRAKTMKTCSTETVEEKVKNIKETNRALGKYKNKFCMIESGKKKPLNSYSFKAPKSELPLCNKLTLPYSPKMCRRSIKETETKTKSIVSEDVFCENEKNSKEGSQHISMDSTSLAIEKTEDIDKKEVQVQNDNQDITAKSPAEKDNFVPIHYSPYVTIRKSGRNSIKKKKSLSVEEEIQKEENEFRCRIFSFRKYIECETRRLLETCDKWRGICEEIKDLPADVEGDINSVIGKTNLLTSDKFMQFKDLIDKCENGDPLIKCDDLQGFQDWVSIEVERIDGDFQKLVKLKCNNWVREVSEEVTSVVKSSKVKSNKNPSNKRPEGKSKIHAHILAAKKLLREKNGGGSPGIALPIFPMEEVATIKTPKRKSSILKDVLNLSSNKFSPVVRERRNSGLEIMIATQKSKLTTPVKIISSLAITTSEVVAKENQTPSQSILKRKSSHSVSSSKRHVTFVPSPVSCRKGLDEKYLRPLIDDSSSPFVGVFSNLNLSSPSMNTRSRLRSRQVN